MDDQLALHRRRSGTLKFAALSLLGWGAAMAMVALFLRAAWYRMETTDFMGRSLLPPQIPHAIVDGVILGSFLAGTFSAILAVLAGVEAFRIWNTPLAVHRILANSEHQAT